MNVFILASSRELVRYGGERRPRAKRCLYNSDHYFRPVAVAPIYNPTAFKILEAIMVDKDRIQGRLSRPRAK
jgi:hypothetical protein